MNRFKKSRSLNFFLVICLILSLSSCATIWNHHSTHVKIKTEPSHAKVELVDEGNCISPCGFDLENKRNHKIIVKKKGFKTLEHTFQMKIYWVVWLNFLVGPSGALGIGIDYLTGKMFSLSKEEIILKLEKSLNGESDDSDEQKESQKIEISEKKEVPQEVQQEQKQMLQSAFGADEVAFSAQEHERIRGTFSEEEIKYQVNLYYGNLTNSELIKVVERIYKELMIMTRNEEELSIDEAVRRDQFRQ